MPHMSQDPGTAWTRGCPQVPRMLRQVGDCLIEAMDRLCIRKPIIGDSSHGSLHADADRPPGII